MKTLLLALLLCIPTVTARAADSYIWRTCEGYQPTWQPVQPWQNWCRRYVLVRPPVQQRQQQLPTRSRPYAHPLRGGR